jgi:molecular chaperone DnaJ
MEVSFRTAVFGGTLQLQTTRRVVCATCKGAGHKGRAPCPTCRGQGRVAQMEKLRVNVPAGMRDGGSIRLPGKGDMGLDGTAGDLYVTIRVAAHPYFERRGDDIHAGVPITIREAYSGAEIRVPTIHGSVSARVPPGTQGGQKFRLRGKGVHDPRAGTTGDHVYTVRIAVPKTISPAGREAAALLDSLYDGDPRAGLPEGPWGRRLGRPSGEALVEVPDDVDCGVGRSRHVALHRERARRDSRERDDAVVGPRHPGTEIDDR